MINNNFIGKSNINSTCLGRKLELQYVANFEVKQRRSLSLLQKRGPYIIFSYQESQNFLLHSISLRFICLQPSTELL